MAPYAPKLDTIANPIEPQLQAPALAPIRAPRKPELPFPRLVHINLIL